MGHPGVLTAGVRRVRGHRLALARAAWVAALALTLGLFALGVPVIAAELRTPCAGAGCYRWQPSPHLAADLAGRGLSLDVYAAYKLALEALFVLGFCALAAVIAMRRPDEPMALFAAVALVTFSGANFSDAIRALGLSAPPW